jgi:pentatricopeptide repeat protein
MKEIIKLIIKGSIKEAIEGYEKTSDLHNYGIFIKYFLSKNQIDKAKEILFSENIKRNAESFNEFIGYYLSQNNIKMANEFLKLMENDKIEPNYHTNFLFINYYLFFEDNLYDALSFFNHKFQMEETYRLFIKYFYQKKNSILILEVFFFFQIIGIIFFN